MPPKKTGFVGVATIISVLYSKARCGLYWLMHWANADGKSNIKSTSSFAYLSECKSLIQQNFLRLSWQLFALKQGKNCLKKRKSVLGSYAGNTVKTLSILSASFWPKKALTATVCLAPSLFASERRNVWAKNFSDGRVFCCADKKRKLGKVKMRASKFWGCHRHCLFYTQNSWT